ncbi:winged-helix domain-containing protein [Sporosarcina sp. FSL K6-1522]|uniref:winged-helix domain-containing protein n=1 Tax=Sporosarcina sp. FSL K6-1522 TaxID=2921554 RepID=UPI00315A3D60
MAKVKSRLHVISVQEAYLTIIAYQLVDIFGEEIELVGTTLRELTMGAIEEQDVVLLSKEELRGITRPFIPESCPVIVAEREINIVGAKELLKLPKGQRILVISNTFEHAEGAAVSIENIYFEHEYTAYNPMDLIPQNVDLIVTLGEREHVPRQFDNVIDIGPRTLDLKTILTLADLLKSESNQFELMNRFFKSQLALAEKVNEQPRFQYDSTFVQREGAGFQVREQVEKDLPLSEDLLREVIEKIEEHGFLEESLAILRIYQEGKRNYESFGRTKVKQALREDGILLSDQQLRLRLEVMQELGLVHARLGRGGTKLADKGEAFLERYKKSVEK